MPLKGLPEYGVTLSGSPEDSVIENHRGGVIIGYDKCHGNRPLWARHCSLLLPSVSRVAPG